MHYDAVVISAGIGGLSAAATLACSGLGVRLLERHTQPGGSASTFTSACPLATVIDREVSRPHARLALGQIWGYSCVSSPFSDLTVTGV
jgi:choline dehydrogenase-like flavoprotein